MVQKSSDHPLRLVVYPMIYRLSKTSLGWMPRSPARPDIKHKVSEKARIPPATSKAKAVPVGMGIVGMGGDSAYFVKEVVRTSFNSWLFFFWCVLGGGCFLNFDFWVVSRNDADFWNFVGFQLILLRSCLVDHSVIPISSLGKDAKRQPLSGVRSEMITRFLPCELGFPLNLPFPRDVFWDFGGAVLWEKVT